MKPKPLTEEEIQAAVLRAVEDARSYVDDEIQPLRIKAAEYYDGKVDVPHEERRSKVVATKVRDTIRAVMPALMRVFLQSGKPVEFAPKTQEAVAGAEQQTEYAQHVFEREQGFSVLHGAFMDALVKKTGIVKVYFEEDVQAEYEEYSNLDPDQLAMLLQDETLEVVEAEEDEDGLLSIKVRKEDRNGRIRMTGVAPEDFFVDRAATSITDAAVYGHASEGVVGDLVAMGFDFEEVIKLASNVEGDEEAFERNNSDHTHSNVYTDPSMRPILITEVHMRMDVEGNGVAERYKFICAGDKYTILDRENCNHEQFAVFEVDPEPHTFFGRSLAELIMDDQNIGTALLRGLLDSVQMMNNPRLLANELANPEDLLNNEIGAVIRVKGQIPPGQAVQELVMGSAAGAALPAIQHHDQVVRGKTGVSNVSMGLNDNALSQNQTATGVDAVMQAEGATVELMARVLAEGGMCQLFKAITKLARAHPQRNEMMRVNGQYVPVDPTSWGDADITVNVGLGTGQKEERIAALMHTLGVQQQVWQGFGPGNGLVTMTGIRHTLTDILRASGLPNADRYYEPMTPEREQALLQQAAQAAQQQQGADPNMALVQVEQMKAQTKAQEGQQKLQIEGAKAMAEEERKRAQAYADNDLARDKMAQDLALRVAEILGKHSIAVDTQAIQREQAAPRV